jgi:hypothetical protein
MDIVTEIRLTSSEDGTCLLCDRPFQARRTGGTPKKFCSPAHRNAFHTAARKWAEKAVADGRITLDDLKRDPAASTLLPPAFSVSPVPLTVRRGAVPQALADEAAQQEASREIPAKICAAKSCRKF